VLQCVAVCCRVLQCVAVCCSESVPIVIRAAIRADFWSWNMYMFVLQCVAVCCNLLQCVAGSVLQCVAFYGSWDTYICTSMATG